MTKNKNYQLGLLYMVHLLVSSDGEITDLERNALDIIRKNENIPDDLFETFRKHVASKKEKEIYQAGIDYLNQCSDGDKLEAFAHLYRISEADGNVHVKEVRLLLYSIRLIGIDFNDVVDYAKKHKS
ncbi:MAG TPA: TerB family tellurite resistance protein [Cyclobacteriaceae bacterium]|nr:TerB family tellurite resistance protein [Cyclobacteriaceae bacterium]